MQFADAALKVLEAGGEFEIRNLRNAAETRSKVTLLPSESVTWANSPTLGSLKLLVAVTSRAADLDVTMDQYIFGFCLRAFLRIYLFSYLRRWKVLGATPLNSLTSKVITFASTHCAFLQACCSCNWLIPVRSLVCYFHRIQAPMVMTHSSSNMAPTGPSTFVPRQSQPF